MRSKPCSCSLLCFLRGLFLLPFARPCFFFVVDVSAKPPEKMQEVGCRKRLQEEAARDASREDAREPAREVAREVPRLSSSKGCEGSKVVVKGPKKPSSVGCWGSWEGGI